MTTVHIGYLKDQTVDLLVLRAEEKNGICEFVFGDIKIIYFVNDEDNEIPWAAYYDGMALMRTHKFSSLAYFLNSVLRCRMDNVVLISFWIEVFV